jgi:TatD DNase family protein
MTGLWKSGIVLRSIRSDYIRVISNSGPSDITRLFLQVDSHLSGQVAIFESTWPSKNTSRDLSITPLRSPKTMAEALKLRYADVGINLGDPVFRGNYRGKQAHEDDLESVVQRALDVGCTKLMVTGSDLKESRRAIELAKHFPGICYATVGVHPCSTQQFDTHKGGMQGMLSDLRKLVLDAQEAGRVVAFGEFGLDYDRLFLSPKDVQLKYFEAQLDLAVELQLPLFLHSRACSEDFERMMKARLHHLPRRGLVHSFTGTIAEMQALVEMGFDIGVNGCSMKTEENLAVVKEVPLERLQIETDGPWCEIRASHASAKFLEGTPVLPKAVKKEKFQKGMMVKGRNESATIVQVANVIAKVKGITVEEVCEAAWKNSTTMFGLGT